jgi:recombination protein U
MNSAKRGREWEDIITRSFKAVLMCSVVKLCAPVRVVRFNKKGFKGRNSGEFTGYFEAKGVCDYEGGYDGAVVCIEAKRTTATRWAFSSIKQHQFDRMMDTFAVHRGIAGVLLAWDHKAGTTAFFAIDIHAISEMQDCGRKSVTPGDLLEMADRPGSGVNVLSPMPTPEGLGVSLTHWLRKKHSSWGM